MTPVIMILCKNKIKTKDILLKLWLVFVPKIRDDLTDDDGRADNDGPTYVDVPAVL